MYAHTQEMLLSNHTRILSVVSNFIGLSSYDWGALSISSHSSSLNGPQLASSDPPIEPQLLARLKEYFVQERGFHGCRPNVEI